jgi:solute carrier family 9B (sodium/hydrogen exchanger), member 1/2
MLLSLSLIIILGFSLQAIFQKLRLPGLLGMLLSGIILGPYILDLISPSLSAISGDLRKIALIVILVRAGLSIDLKDLRKAGRPALLMCFIPATFEIAGVVLLAPPLMHISYLEAAILGTILAAVSPAIAVPKMLHLMETGYGQEHRVPQLIMAGASIDNIYNIALFTAFMGIYTSQEFRPVSIIKLPISMLVGLAAGILIGYVLVRIFKSTHIRDTVKVLIILGVSFCLVGLEETINRSVPFSGLLAVMALGGTILKAYEILAKRIAGKFSKIWVAAELVLFVLLGAIVDIRSVAGIGLSVVLLILGALLFRSIGVFLSVSGTGIPIKEKLFCIIAYLPKATVQAAIGALPLAAGVPAGNAILTVAVVAVLITSPLGAIGIERTYHRLLGRTIDQHKQPV